MGVILAGEVLTGNEVALIITIFVGIILVVTNHHLQLHYHKRMLEKGVMMDGLGAVGMALSNFLVGFASESLSPTFVAIACFGYLFTTKEVKNTFKLLKNNFGIIAG